MSHGSDRLQLRAAFTHLANDLLIAAGAERSWLLSRVETGLLRAVGLPAGYVPYYPVAEALDKLGMVRSRLATVRRNLVTSLCMGCASRLQGRSSPFQGQRGSVSSLRWSAPTHARVNFWLGIELCSQMCRQLLDEGAPGIHFITMNRSTATREVWQHLAPTSSPGIAA